MSIAKKLTRIAENEQKVYEAGYEKGKAEGENYDQGYADGRSDGYNEGKAEGIEQGKQAEYDAFWDSIQAYGTRTSYERAFEITQWEKPFNPKYSFGNVTKAPYAFQGTKVGDNLYTDKLDFSKCVSMVATFASSDVTRLKRIDMRACAAAYNGAATTFGWCEKLREITEFYPPINTEPLSTTFQNCNALETINFCSEIAVNNFNFQWSTKLSKASIESIINALSADTSGLTVTLSATAVNTAFESAEGLADGSSSDEWLALIAAKANWTISLV